MGPTNRRKWSRRKLITATALTGLVTFALEWLGLRRVAGLPVSTSFLFLVPTGVITTAAGAIGCYAALQPEPLRLSFLFQWNNYWRVVIILTLALQAICAGFGVVLFLSSGNLAAACWMSVLAALLPFLTARFVRAVVRRQWPGSSVSGRSA